MKYADVVIVGGGLAGATCALALAAHRPQASVVIIEREPELGGNHTWCMHADDVSADDLPIVAPAIAQRWDGYTVEFPDLQRDLASPYTAVTSASLAAAVRAALAARPSFELVTGRTAVDLAAHQVVLDDGRGFVAPLVVDARGPARYRPEGVDLGYQKFVGLEVELARPHGLRAPILMDATVAQIDGFRFFYVLPLAPTRLLIEDTYYADTPTLDDSRLVAGIHAYAAQRGWTIVDVARRERGVLPIPLTLTAPAALGDGPIVAGYQGGWFHPTTGYSFPLAVRVAALIARGHEPGFPTAWAALAAEVQRQATFAVRLNRMMFGWFAPDRRYHAMSRFYRLPEPTIRRFYALRTTWMDRARTLFGRPPRGMSWRAVISGGAVP
ncbi:MAG TPA: lycopene beta-cyclase CrtY [Kofleriaceae bacterium]|nr:lycopene beta-cyclase CrtY [Kofleriaceae bacterium]